MSTPSRKFGFRRNNSRSGSGGVEESLTATDNAVDNADATPASGENPEAFVMAPPQRGRNITSGISRLFRRPSSKEPSERMRSMERNGAEATSSKNAKADDIEKSSKEQSATQPPLPPQGDIGIPKSNSRLFYSSNLEDDDSEDSYESRVSRRSISASSYAGSEVAEEEPPKPMIRYRGFSTSIRNLFLDEQLVCAAIGCFGLILSQRTEHLLNLRNERRGLKPRSSDREFSRQPSRILWISLTITFVLICITYMVFGFGTGEGSRYASNYVDGYDYDMDENNNNNYYNNNDDNNYFNDDYNNDDYNNDDGNNDNNDDYNNDDGNNYNNVDDNYNNDDNNDDQNNGRRANMMEDSNALLTIPIKHSINGIFKIRDYQENIWEPVAGFIKDEWFRENNTSTNHSQNMRDLDQNGWDDWYTNDYEDAGYDVVEEQQPQESFSIDSSIRGFLCIMFIILLGVLGRRRRMRARYALLRARAHEDHLYYASLEANRGHRMKYKYTRENQYEGACSHTLCGCYPVDPPLDEEEKQQLQEAEGLYTKKRKNGDCLSRLFSCFMASCCGLICKCWFQCMSVCALAQEAREIRLLLPPRLQRIDFITHQPFHEYQKDVNDLRRGWMGKDRAKGGIMPHIYALSRLSRYIIMFFTVGTASLILTLILNPRAAFSWDDAVVLIATFLQSFVVLYVVHWIFHKSDLSFDGVTKFFAAGFIIAAPASFVFEGFLVNLILFLVYAVYAIVELIKGDVFVDWVVNNYRIIWILGEFFNAYVVAAVTEEVCKYFTFRSVEHPDLIFLTGLDRKSHEDYAVRGGDTNYEFGSHQVSHFNQRVNSFASSSVYSTKSRSTHSRSEFEIERTATIEEFYEDDADVRSYRQKAAAITTGMISAAIGLACAENFLYVFLLGGVAGSNNGDNDDRGGGSNIREEWIILLFRSVFPVHALAAAMQSINMIRKFVECTTDTNNHNIGVGRIILPAVILHGTFDAILLGVNVYIESAWDKYLEENQGNIGEGQPYNTILVNVLAWLSILFVMCSGIFWYINEHKSQQVRLHVMEDEEKARTGASKQYTNPSVPSEGLSKLEIV